MGNKYSSNCDGELINKTQPELSVLLLGTEEAKSWFHTRF